MQFITTSFDELTVRQLQQIYKLRVAVFVVEQACPYQEVDDTDLMAWHLRGLDSTGQLLVYARLMREANQQARIGRVITNPAVRGTATVSSCSNRRLCRFKRCGLPRRKSIFRPSIT